MWGGQAGSEWDLGSSFTMGAWYSAQTMAEARGHLFLAGTGLGWSDAEGSLLEAGLHVLGHRTVCGGVCVMVPGRHGLEACAREAERALE